MNTKAKIMKKINADNCNRMLEKSTSLNAATNPFIKNLSSLSGKELETFLGQYCHFPRHIISVLVSACYTMGYHQWNDVVKELRDNIHEELGSGYGEISKKLPPHYSMLRKALMEGLGLDINNIAMNKATNKFVHSLNEHMNESASVTAGAVYALEATAVQELQIVSDITERLFAMKRITMPKLLKDFFKFHISVIEIKHQERLLNMMYKYIEDESSALEFESGFKFTVDLMDKWWSALYKEIKTKREDD